MELFDTSVIVQLVSKAIQAWSFLWVKIFDYRFNLFEGYNITENLFGDFFFFWLSFGELKFSSVTQLCPTLCDLMDFSMPGSPVHHQLPEPTQTHPSCQWCHPTISSPVMPFSSCLQSFPASRFFQMSQFFAPGSQRIRVSASASVLLVNIQGWSPLGWTGWTLLAVQGTIKSLLQHHSSKASIVWRSAFFIVQLSHPHMTTGKTIALTRGTFVGTIDTMYKIDN